MAAQELTPRSVACGDSEGPPIQVEIQPNTPKLQTYLDGVRVEGRDGGGCELALDGAARTGLLLELVGLPDGEHSVILDGGRIFRREYPLSVSQERRSFSIWYRQLTELENCSLNDSCRPLVNASGIDPELDIETKLRVFSYRLAAMLILGDTDTTRTVCLPFGESTPPRDDLASLGIEVLPDDVCGEDGRGDPQEWDLRPMRAVKMIPPLVREVRPGSYTTYVGVPTYKWTCILRVAEDVEVIRCDLAFIV